jgi:acyl-coenzyme A thioesterase PaaI-like protein
MNTPAGFVPYARPSTYFVLIGPVLESETDPTVLGLLLDQRHSNARGFTRAGVLVALADTLMGHTAQRAGPPDTRLVTVSLTTDFPGTAHVGDWLTGIAAVQRIGRTLAFTTSQIHRRKPAGPQGQRRVRRSGPQGTPMNPRPRAPMTCAGLSGDDEEPHPRRGPRRQVLRMQPDLSLGPRVDAGPRSTARCGRCV